MLAEDKASWTRDKRLYYSWVRDKEMHYQYCYYGLSSHQDVHICSSSLSLSIPTGQQQEEVQIRQPRFGDFFVLFSFQFRMKCFLFSVLRQ